MFYLSGAENEGTRMLATSHPVGVIVGPGKWSLSRLAPYRMWAADNGCFSKGEAFDLGAYLCWLATLPTDGCLFATAPDVVGDARATWERSRRVLPAIRRMGFPAALVAQDGLDHTALDWDAFDCLFVGGTTVYKLSESAYAAVREAKRRGKHTHMGRVNSLRRLRLAAMAGYDSADGTFLKFGPVKNAPRVRAWLDELRRQPSLPMGAA